MSPIAWWFAAAAVVLAVATRSVGVAAALGIGTFAVLRGRTSRGLVAAGCGVAAVCAPLLWSALRLDGGPDPSADFLENTCDIFPDNPEQHKKNSK